MTQNEMITTWLKDAHAMETAIIPVLEKQVEATADFPEVQRGIQQHLEATKRHKESVESCLEELGESASALKAGMAGAGGKIQGLMADMPADGLVKGMLQDYSTEHMEIASYKALIVAAGDAGLTRVAEACTAILQDEEQMASWIDQQLPHVVRATLAEQSA